MSREIEAEAALERAYFEEFGARCGLRPTLIFLIEIRRRYCEKQSGAI
jgi:hypothetical protein